MWSMCIIPGSNNGGAQGRHAVGTRVGVDHGTLGAIKERAIAIGHACAHAAFPASLTVLCGKTTQDVDVGCTPQTVHAPPSTPDLTHAGPARTAGVVRSAKRSRCLGCIVVGRLGVDRRILGVWSNAVGVVVGVNGMYGRCGDG